MNKRILFVDDDEMILRSFKRDLSGHFEVSTALGPEEALKLMHGKPVFAVVVSDLKMPSMDGITFLGHVAEAWPNTVRVMLTGYADMDAAINAVNKGRVFRFLTKPCESEPLRDTLMASVKQHRLVTAEKELLERTLKGSIEVLVEALSLANNEAYGRSVRILRYMRQVGKQFIRKGFWKYEVAAMLSQLGCLILPHATTGQLSGDQVMDSETQQFLAMAPEVTRNLLSKIPRMEDVALMVAYQQKNFDGTGNPRDNVKGEDIPLGGRLLKLLSDFETEVSSGKSTGEAFLHLEKNADLYDPELMYYLEGALGVEARYKKTKLRIKQLIPGMLFNQDVIAHNKVLLARKSLEVTTVLLYRLLSFAKTVGVDEPVEVLVPLEEGEEAEEDS